MEANPMFMALIPPSYEPPLLAPTPDEVIEGHVVALTASYRAGLTRPLAARKAQLRQLRALLSDGLATLEHAMWLDLHKHPTEMYATEVASCLREIQDHLDHLKSWTSPMRVGTNFANFPASSHIVQEPRGVCGIMSTWNYPIYVTLMPLIGCISAGNVALVRLPTEGTCDHVSGALAYLMDKYLDPAVVRYVAGGIDATKALLRHPYDLLFCTGGATIGKVVARAAAETLTPTVLELGGKSPAIVHSDTSLEMTARRLVWGAFLNAGQTGIRPDYVFAHESIGPALVEAMRQAIVDAYGASPADSQSYGRLVNAAQFDRIERIFETDRAFLVHGGIGDRAQRYFAPTLLNFEGDYTAFAASACMQAEIFGPLLPIVYYHDVDEPLLHIATHATPMAVYIFTGSSAVKQFVITHSRSGSMCVNDVMVQVTNHKLPFGGMGASGMGAYHGRFSFAAFSHAKAVMHMSFLWDFRQRYAPYTPFARKLLGAVLHPVPRVWLWVFRVVVVLAIVGIVLGLTLR
ncbi:aldehyde dehydrogenase [Achlya hypogyna]|uniref:Aldehyde dehydrogenase n=1 Tax=Achlya hypogyna TaxID=1202772 RepID=A0A1V9Z0P5_ACHHY|nr:aldehyde dehydrogenase [Achlya hypogyna]